MAYIRNFTEFEDLLSQSFDAPTMGTSLNFNSPAKGLVTIPDGFAPANDASSRPTFKLASLGLDDISGPIMVSSWDHA